MFACTNYACNYCYSNIISLENGDSLVGYYSSKRVRKDAFKRQEDIEKIQNHVHSTSKNKLTSRLRKPYVKVDKACKIIIDSEILAQEAQFDGLFALQTSIKKRLQKNY